MAFIGLILLLVAYTALAGLIVQKVFPSSVDTEQVYIAFGVSNVLALLGIASNGFLPLMPLAPQDMWLFLIALYFGTVAFNCIALKLTLFRAGLDWLICLIMAAILNLVLCGVLGVPMFFAVLSISDLLFR